MTLSVSNPRAKSRWTALALVVGLALLVTSVSAVLAGPVSNGAGFEGDDANLVVNDAAKMDWNGFDPVAWTGTAPNREAHKTAAGWSFDGLEDAQNSGVDNVFGGGVKQDNDCATTGSGPKPPNKDDLSRIYLAQKAVGANWYLALAWVRVPQNSTTASAHVAFEFNQGSNGPCATGSLVKRTVGDMLIVYDFAGGSSAPILKLLRWRTDTQTATGVTSAICEQTNKAATAAGCWVVQYANLNASGLAEAGVNVGSTALDQIAPGGPVTLGPVEFGEAIINLTGAGVFPRADIPATECLTFGSVFAVSRSSGNSGTAQMKDLVGPADADVTNCGSIIVEKVDDATPPNRLAGAGFTVTPGKTTGSTTAASSPMVEINGRTGLFCLDNLLIGVEYTITESTVPEGYSGADPKTFTVTTASTCAGRIAAAAPNEPAPDAGMTFVNVPNVADLSALKEVSSDGGETWASTATASPGDTLSYRITFSNDGNASGQVSPTDDLSDVLEHATFNDDCQADAVDTGCTLSAADILSFAGSPFTVVAGGELVLTYSVDIDESGFDDSVELVNLIVEAETCPDGTEDPNCSTTTTVDLDPDVTITKVVTSNFPPTFDVTVDAVGTGTSTDVVVSDTLPADWAWALTGDYGTCDDDADELTPFDPASVAGGTTITCDLGDMAEATSKTFTITAIQGPGLSNTASVESGNQSTNDNKTDTATIADILASFVPE